MEFFSGLFARPLNFFHLDRYFGLTIGDVFFYLLLICTLLIFLSVCERLDKKGFYAGYSPFWFKKTLVTLQTIIAPPILVFAVLEPFVHNHINVVIAAIITTATHDSLSDAGQKLNIPPRIQIFLGKKITPISKPPQSRG